MKESTAYLVPCLYRTVTGTYLFSTFGSFLAKNPHNFGFSASGQIFFGPVAPGISTPFLQGTTPPFPGCQSMIQKGDCYCIGYIRTICIIQNACTIPEQYPSKLWFRLAFVQLSKLSPLTPQTFRKKHLVKPLLQAVQFTGKNGRKSKSFMCTSSQIRRRVISHRTFRASLRSWLAFECCEGREYIDLWSSLTDSWTWSSIPFATVGSVPGSVSDGQSESHWSWCSSKQPQQTGTESHFPTVFFLIERLRTEKSDKKNAHLAVVSQHWWSRIPAANKNTVSTFSETRKKWPDCTSPVAVSPSACTLHSWAAVSQVNKKRQGQERCYKRYFLWQIGTCCVQEPIPPMGLWSQN